MLAGLFITYGRISLATAVRFIVLQTFASGLGILGALENKPCQKSWKKKSNSHMMHHFCIWLALMISNTEQNIMLGRLALPTIQC